MFSKIKAIRDMRSQAKKIDSTLSGVIAEGKSHGVLIKMNGRQDILELTIPDDLERTRIANAIKEALADVMHKLQKEVKSAIKDAGGLPDMSKLGM